MGNAPQTFIQSLARRARGHSSNRVSCYSQEEDKMPSRRNFLKTLAGASAGAFFLPHNGDGAPQGQQPRPGAKPAPVTIAGRRVKTIDVHFHIDVPEVADFLKGTPLERAANRPAPTGRQR